MFLFKKKDLFRLSIIFLSFNISLKSSTASPAVCENDSVIVHLSTSNDNGNNSHIIFTSTFDRDSGIVVNCQQQMLVDGTWTATTCQTAFWEKTDTIRNVNGAPVEYLTLTGSLSGWTSKSSTTFNYSATGKIIQVTSRIWNGSAWDSTYYKIQQYDSQDNLILTETFTQNSGTWIKNNQVEINYLSGMIISKRFSSGNLQNNWENDSLFNFNYTGAIRSSVEVSFWDNINGNWTLSGLFNYNLVNNDYSFHVDKLSPRILSGNLVYDSLAYEIDTLETIVYTYNKIFTLSHPFPSDYYRYNINSTDNDRIDSAYVLKKTMSGNYFLEIFSPGDTMIANFSRDVRTEYFYNSSLQIIEVTSNGGCTNPCGSSSQYAYDSTGFMTNYDHYWWTMVSDRYYHDSYSHHNNTQPSVIVPDWEKVIATCDTSSYQPNLIIAGGCGPYSVLWTPSTGLSSDSVLNPLIQITDTVEYTILITDNNGITDTANFNVLPIFTSADLVVDSGGCGGSVTLSLPYNENLYYAWYKNNLRLVGLDSNVIVVTDPGTYRAGVSATYANPNGNSVNCSHYSNLFNITIPAVITVYENVDLCNGSAFALPDGNIVELPGLYISTLQSSNGCDSIIETTIHVSDLPVISTSIIPIRCYGDSAEISVSATGGSGPYSGTGLFHYPAGQYTISVTDNAGCADTDTLIIGAPTPLIADAGNPVYLCTEGQIQLGGSPTATGGTGNLYYIWTPGALLISDTDSNPIANINLSTIYNVIVTDDNGCSATSSVHIQVSDLIPPVISQSGNILSANSNAFNYNWYFNNTLILSGNFPTLTATQDGDYGVIVTDAEGCNYTAPVFAYSLNSTDLPEYNSGIKLYPNPAKGECYIELGDINAETELNIFDITGKKVMNYHLQDLINRVDVSMLSSGVYTIRFSDGSGIIFKQLIIERN